MKTYVWLSPEKLKFINSKPEIVSLLYDLGLLPEEISARVRAYVEEATKATDLQKDALLAYYNWSMNAGSWSDVSLKPEDGSRWKITPQEHLQGEMLSDAVDKLIGEQTEKREGHSEKGQGHGS